MFDVFDRFDMVDMFDQCVGPAHLAAPHRRTTLMRALLRRLDQLSAPLPPLLALNLPSSVASYALCGVEAADPWAPGAGPKPTAPAVRTGPALAATPSPTLQAAGPAAPAAQHATARAMAEAQGDREQLPVWLLRALSALAAVSRRAAKRVRRGQSHVTRACHVRQVSVHIRNGKRPCAGSSLLHADQSRARLAPAPARQAACSPAALPNPIQRSRTVPSLPHPGCRTP
jgi:hypothetical protein